MLKRRIDPRGTEIEIFVPEDQAERDLLAGIVNHHIPERYNVMAAEPALACPDGVHGGDECGVKWPEYVAFGLILSRASRVSMYSADENDGLMGLYFRAYVTTDPEERIQVDLVIEDNNQKHLEAICGIVYKKKPSGRSWTAYVALGFPAEFMVSVNEGLDSDLEKRTEWVQI